MIIQKLQQVIFKALKEAITSGEINLSEIPEIKIEQPKDSKFGDYSSSIALNLAKPLKMTPVKIAEIIKKFVKDDNIDSIEVVNPGFINFRLSMNCLRENLRQIQIHQKDYGKVNIGKNQKILLEYISANPTGPLHIGHGRWAVLGDSLARLMKTAGFDLVTEFYINDAGSQVFNFGNSIKVRYLQLLQRKFPELTEEINNKYTSLFELFKKDKEPNSEGLFYHGDYINDLAFSIFEKYKKDYIDSPVEKFADFGMNLIIKNQKKVLEKLGVKFDIWFKESDLHKNGEVDKIIDFLNKNNQTIKKEGALWLKTSEYGLKKDEVLIKSNGDKTYFLTDIAYHKNKFDRGFEKLINIWGADHHGHVPRMKAAIQALGKSPDSLYVILGQMVNLYRGKERIRMSKRSGEIITTEEIIEEVGSDATRYLLLLRGANTPIDFDIELAKKQSSENPVFYVQYAHARICSIFRQAQTKISFNEEKMKEADLSLLNSPQERILLLRLMSFIDEIINAVFLLEPYKLTKYAENLATDFHQFYTNCKVIDPDNISLTYARLNLCNGTKIVLRNLLEDILGVNAPQIM